MEEKAKYLKRVENRKKALEVNSRVRRRSRQKRFASNRAECVSGVGAIGEFLVVQKAIVEGAEGRKNDIGVVNEV